MRGGGTGTTPGSEPGGPRSNRGLAAIDVSAAVGLLRSGGSFDPTVAGSSPAVLRGVAQRSEHWSVLRRSGSQADSPLRSAAKDGLPSLAEAPRARRSTRHRSFARFPDRTDPQPPHQQRREEGVMPKFSGTKRRPLRTNLTAPIAHHARAHPHPRGRRGASRATRSRSCSCSPRPTWSARTPSTSAPTTRDARFVELVHEVDRVEPGVHRRRRPDAGKVGLAPVPARDDAHALGRGRDGRRVRRRRRRRAAGRWSRAPCSAPTSRPSCSATG